MVKLNLGCGDKILPGYVNVDAASSRAGRQPDFVADIRDLRKIKSSIADEILAVHVIEHFYYLGGCPSSAELASFIEA